MRVSSAMFSDTAVIVHPGTREDRVGSPLDDWDTATRVTTRARFSQVARAEGSEEHAQRDVEVSHWVAYLPAGTDIDARCRIERDGTVFEMQGPPYIPTTVAGPAQVQCSLRLVVG